MRGLQHLGCDALGLEAGAQLLDGLESACRNASRRAVFSRERQARTQARQQLGRRQAYRQHRTCGQRLHERAAMRHEPCRIFQLHDAGEHGCREFADAVPDQGHRLHA